MHSLPVSSEMTKEKEQLRSWFHDSLPGKAAGVEGCVESWEQERATCFVYMSGSLSTHLLFHRPVSSPTP